MAKLLVYQGDQVVREVPLERDPFMIGRALESDLAVMDHLVSRKHAKIIRDPGGTFRVIDLGSSNGIYVNEERVTERVLAENDRLRIGSATFEFKEDKVPETADVPPPPKPRRSGTLSVMLTPEGADMDSGVSVIKSVRELRPDYGSVHGTPAAGLLALYRDRSQRQKAPTTPQQVTAREGKDGLHFFILFQLAQAVNSATSLEDLFERAADMICEALEAGNGAIMTIDRSGGAAPEASPGSGAVGVDSPQAPLAAAPAGKLVQRAARSRLGGKQVTAGEIHVSQTIVNRVISERVAILTRDALLDDRFKAGKSVAAMQIRSAICVPIWDQEDVDGVIYLDSSHAAGVFSEEDRDLVTAVGHQLAVAIKREEMTARLRSEAVVRSNLERYHSPDVVDMIIARQGRIELEVKEADVSVLFADIEGFTKMSERLAPAEVARILNGYFEGTTSAIFKHRGQVNKYIGDAILAVFGAPLANPDHAADACRAALAMLESLREFRRTLPGTEKFRLRIGINSGPVVAGNIGSARRMEYTVIGSTVNIASRLEKIAPPDGITIGPDVEARIRGRFKVQAVGPVGLKGIEKDLQVFHLLGE